MKFSAIQNPKLWIAGLLAAIATGTAIWVKLSLTSGALLPGIDGAYYWVQARSILEHGRLAFDDLPLILVIQAGLGALFGNIPLGVRISDAVLPALSAIPIFFMMKDNKRVWVPAIAIAAVLLNPVQLFFFTGNFIKNAAAIPLVFVIGLILMRWEKLSHRKAIIGLVSTLIVLALCHFGVLLLGILLVSVWLLMQLRKRHWKFWSKAIAIAAGVIGLVLASLAIFVPARFERLMSLVSNPLSLFADPTWQAMFNMRAEFSTTFSTISGQLGAIALAIVGWLIRRKLSFSDRSLLVSSLAAAFLLSSPFIANEWSNRLSAMIFVPLSLAAILITLRTDKLWPKVIPTALALSAIVISALSFSNQHGQMLMSDSQYAEFQKMAKSVNLPKNSAVVARHGIEFLVAWDMQVDVIQDNYYQEADKSKYSHIYVLQSSVGGLGGGGAAPGQAGQMPNGFGSTPPKFDGKNRPSFGPPPSGGNPPSFGNQDNSKAPSFGNRPDGGVMNLTGETIFKSDNLTLMKIR